jgi:phosphate transport system permease protein
MAFFTGTARSGPWALRLLAFVGLLAIAAVFILLLGGTLLVVLRTPLAPFLNDITWQPEAGRYGIWPLLIGTVLVTGVAMIVALPLGLFIALYLSEFATPRYRRIVKPVIELLSAIPPIVYGTLALLTLTPILQALLPSVHSRNALSAGLALALMIMPLMASLSDDALRAVPSALREAAYALGADRHRVLISVVIPTAASGITSAMVVAAARAMGESMIVAIAATGLSRLTLDPRQPADTLASGVLHITRGLPDESAIFLIGALLVLLSLLMTWFGRRLTEKVSR